LPVGMTDWLDEGVCAAAYVIGWLAMDWLAIAWLPTLLVVTMLFMGTCVAEFVCGVEYVCGAEYVME